MTALTGLELRKAACEALGWRWVAKFYLEDLPGIESDPAVSEPMFLEWCEKNGIRWEMK